MHVRDCAVGEIRGQTEDVCDRCPATQYNFNTSSPVCDSPCPENANCLGGSNMYPDSGFWRSSLYSTFMHSCPKQEACRYAQLQDAKLWPYSQYAVCPVSTQCLDTMCCLPCRSVLKWVLDPTRNSLCRRGHLVWYQSMKGRTTAPGSMLCLQKPMIPQLPMCFVLWNHSHASASEAPYTSHSRPL